MPHPPDVSPSERFKEYLKNEEILVQSEQEEPGVLMTGGELPLCYEVLNANLFLEWSEEDIVHLAQRVVAWWDADKDYLGGGGNPRLDREEIRILTLAAADGRICYHNTKEIVCRDLQTGRKRWSTACPPLGGSRHSAGTLVIYDDVVLYTGAKGVVALTADTGEQLWMGPKVSGPGIAHPPDLFVAGGLVWGGDETGMHSKDRTFVHRDGRDLRTG